MAATKYTLQDVAERNTDGAVYVAIHGKVYNCTQFIEHHPGGAEAILEFAGMDASQPFDEIQHSGDALEILGTLCVGELESSSRKHNITQADEEMNQHLSRGKVAKSGVAGLGTMGNVTLLFLFCLAVYYGASSSSYQSA